MKKIIKNSDSGLRCRRNDRGFTLIEIMVAVSIFVIVMLIAIGALINAVDANRKAQALSNVINNVNFSLESMIRDIRTGTQYSVSGTSFTFHDTFDNVITYNLNSQKILKSVGVNFGATHQPVGGFITSTQVVIESLDFTLQGGGKGDGQPAVLIHISGKAGNGKTTSSFKVETLVTQRLLDPDV